MLAWATATFWFPLMIAIGVWRHVVSRVPLRYHPSYWALVFPLGMYGVGHAPDADATDLATLDWLPPVVLVYRPHRLGAGLGGAGGRRDSRAWRTNPVAASRTG